MHLLAMQKEILIKTYAITTDRIYDMKNIKSNQMVLTYVHCWIKS